MAFQSIRGFKDILPPESEQAARLEAIAREAFRRFGFRELRLPTLETQELFVKSTGETTDIVEKEMFLLEDSGGRKLALRPEGTPGVVRAYLQNGLHQQGGQVKVFYMGSMFRAERPQAGRFREFTQIGAETFGNAHPAADAEAVLVLAEILDQAGLSGKYDVHINNLGDENPDCRPAYRAKLLAFLHKVKAELCEHCVRRMERNPLRVLDCKADGPRLRADPHMPFLKPCRECHDHFSVVTELLRAGGIRYEENPGLVRGLDYYTRTVFEFKSNALGAQDAVAGGGRYDGLVKAMGGPETPAVGWALGLERTLMAVKAAKSSDPALEPDAEKTDVYVAVQSPNPEIQLQAFTVLSRLRQSAPAGGGLFGNSLKSQMRDADRLKARYVVIFGDEESKRGECVVKDMSAKDSQEVVKQDALVDWLRGRLSKGGKP
jgi:histidyl-tRNA synthetase